MTTTTRARGHTSTHRGPRTRHGTWADRAAQRNRLREERLKARVLRAQRRAEWAARAQMVGHLFAMSGRGIGATARFVGPKVATTYRRGAPLANRAARRAGWAPQQPVRQTVRDWRADAGAHGVGHVMVTDWADGERVPHRDVDEWMGAHAVSQGEDVRWVDLPHDPPAKPDSGTDKPRRVPFWRARREARAWSANVDQALDAWRTGRPDHNVPDLDPAPVPLELEAKSHVMSPPRPPIPMPGAPASPTPATFGDGDRVRHLRWGTSGTVRQPEDGATTEVRWDGTSVADELVLVEADLVHVPRRPLVPPRGSHRTRAAPDGVATLVLPARRRTTDERTATMAATSTSSDLRAFDELLDPDWSQQTFDEDVPDWLDQLTIVETRLAELTAELAELGDRVELPTQTRTLLRSIADAQGEIPAMASQAASQCRDLYESYEIPKLEN